MKEFYEEAPAELRAAYRQAQEDSPERARAEAIARQERQMRELRAEQAAANRQEERERRDIVKQLYDMDVPENQIANLTNLTPDQLSAVKAAINIEGPFLNESDRVPETLLLPPPERPEELFDNAEALEERQQELESQLGGMYSRYRGQLQGIRNRMRTTAESERTALGLQNAISANQIAEENEARSEFRDDFRDLVKQQEIARKVRREAKERSRRDIDNAVSEVMEMRINPNRIFNNTSSRVVAAVAAGLGEFGRTLAGGGTNTALQIINSAINRDIDAQKEAIRTAQAGIGLKENAYQRLVDLHGDDEKAELLVRQQALSFAKMKVGEIVDRYKVPLEQTKLAGLVAGIDKALLQNEITLADKEFAARVQEFQLTAKRGSPVKFTAKEEEFFDQFFEFRTNLNDLENMYYGRGVYKKDGPMFGTFQTPLRQGQEYLFGEEGKAVKGAGAGVLDLRAARFYDAAAKLSKSFSSIKEGGKISDMDLIFYLKRVPLPSDGDEMIEQKFRTLRQFSEAALKLRQGRLSPEKFAIINKQIQMTAVRDGITQVTNENDLRKLEELVYGKGRPSGPSL